VKCCCRSTSASSLGAIVIIMGAVVATQGSSGDDVKDANVLDHTVTTIEGEPRALNAYAGDVVLIVNTASKCGLTPQYEGLQALYESHKDEGFVVLGFPANNFGNQEPGSDDEIETFCEQRYGVSFPMFSKISVKGDDIHPLYKQLTGMPEPIGGEVQWNFQKYVVDRDGRVVAKFGPRTAPDDPELVGLIESLLTEQAG